MGDGESACEAGLLWDALLDGKFSQRGAVGSGARPALEDWIRVG